jgi:hypothetical protein
MMMSAHPADLLLQSADLVKKSAPGDIDDVERLSSMQQALTGAVVVVALACTVEPYSFNRCS